MFLSAHGCDHVRFSEEYGDVFIIQREFTNVSMCHIFQSEGKYQFYQ
jgi:hypothetical protein